MGKPESIADLEAAPYNPRSIAPEALAGLKRSLGEFGDISGLVFNERSGNLVAGHQRLAALKAEHGDGLRFEGGAVVAPSGERFPVRVVDWPTAKEKAANVAANSPLLAGDWTDGLGGLLDELRLEADDLFEGLRLGELAGLEGAVEEPPPPDEFKAIGEDIDTERECPSCGYRWSGPA